MLSAPAWKRCSRVGRLTLIAVVAVLFGPEPASGLTYATVADHDLAQQAEVIARVEVTGERFGSSGSRISTIYDVVIIELLRGDVVASRLSIRVPGGRDPASGRFVKIWGAPELRLGETVLVFLRTNSDGTLRILHLGQGLFRRALSGGEFVWFRDITEARTDGRVARHERRFLAWLRDCQDGLARLPDYWVEVSGEAPLARPLAFSVLGGELLRWVEFDQGGRLRWHRDRKGQAGLDDGGAAAFRKALKAWRRAKSGAPVRLRSAGTTRSTTGFLDFDGRNSVLFRDYNGIFGDDFDCETGGAIAAGGVLWAEPSGIVWKGREFLANIEGEIVMNDGVECLFEAEPSIALQVYVHELGHTLGLGHSCGDGASPSCGRSAVLDDATMRAFVQPPGRGARLGVDDIAGIRFLYDPEFIAAPCHLAPGSRRFCAQCFPCGEGQGNCRRDLECYGDLVCAKDVGAEFGFKPKTNVCVPPPS